MLKSRFAKLLRERVLLQRLPGVFPQGIQPRNLVLVIDAKAPYLNKESFKDSVSTIVEGENMDAVDFFEAIRNDDCFDDDDALYIVIPWLDFIFKHLKAQPQHAANSDSTHHYGPQSKDATISAMNKCVRSVNAVKDLRFNPMIETDYEGKLDFISSLDPICSVDKPELRSVTAIAHRVIQSAHQLRTAILSRCSNSEVVFCGYPTTCLVTKDLEDTLVGKVSCL